MWFTWAGAVAALAGPLDPASFPPLAASWSPVGVTIDTDAVTFGPYAGVLHGDVAVFAFGSLTIGSGVLVVGSRPLAILTTGDLVVDGPLVASGAGDVGGPGGYDASKGDDGPGPGGGQAYDVGTGGAFCGDGGAADDGQRPGGIAYGDLQSFLEGGSAGGSSTDGGEGGGGGGAIELGALGSLVISGDVIARGGDAEDVKKYGGGGGAGGGVLLHGGLGSVCTATVSAGGGDGGTSEDDKGGGGGGGGCLVALGLDVSGCTLVADGGEGGGGSADADGGANAEPTVVVDPDTDGDGFTLQEGDCNDLDPAIGPDDCSELTPNDTGTAGTVGTSAPTGATDGPRTDGARPREPGSEGPGEEVRIGPGYRLFGCASAPGASSAFPLVGLLALRRRRAGRSP